LRSFIRNLDILEIWMPFAESADYETAIRGSDGESREHLPAASLEPDLKIVRSVGDLARIGERLAALECCLLEPGLRARIVRKRDDRGKRQRDRATLDASAVAWSQAEANIRRCAV
jgi:hypothetical protein